MSWLATSGAILDHKQGVAALLRDLLLVNLRASWPGRMGSQLPHEAVLVVATRVGSLDPLQSGAAEVWNGQDSNCGRSSDATPLRSALGLPTVPPQALDHVGPWGHRARRQRHVAGAR